MNWRDATLPLLLVIAGCGPRPAPTQEATPGSAEVIATAQALFDALGSRDTAALRALMLPTGVFVAAADGNVRVSDVDQITASLGAEGPALLERMWDPEVRMNGGIATVWTAYDFHRDGAFSHCGIDAFQMVREANGTWRVASVIYTVQRDDCAPSPLGPPAGAGVG